MSAWRHGGLVHVALANDKIRADSRFAPSQWETALLCNDVSHWLGANVDSALKIIYIYINSRYSNIISLCIVCLVRLHAGNNSRFRCIIYYNQIVWNLTFSESKFPDHGTLWDHEPRRISGHCPLLVRLRHLTKPPAADQHVWSQSNMWLDQTRYVPLPCCYSPWRPCWLWAATWTRFINTLKLKIDFFCMNIFVFRLKFHWSLFQHCVI